MKKLTTILTLSLALTSPSWSCPDMEVEDFPASSKTIRYLKQDHEFLRKFIYGECYEVLKEYKKPVNFPINYNLAFDRFLDILQEFQYCSLENICLNDLSKRDVLNYYTCLDALGDVCVDFHKTISEKVREQK